MKNKDKYHVPTSWDQVTYAQFLKIKPGLPITQILEILWNEPEIRISGMHLDIEKIMKALEFMTQPVKQSVWELAPKSIEDLTVNRYEDFKTEASKLKGVPEDFDHYPTLFAFYYGHEYDADMIDDCAEIAMTRPCGVVLGTVQYYLSQVKKIEERWAALFPQGGGYNGEQIQAGYKSLDEFFGFMSTVIFVESQTKYTREQLLEMPVREFKFNLLFLARRADADKKYHDIQTAKMQAQQRTRRR